MKISVVICTWNRAASLARTLESIARSAPPRRAAWQIVVVDNNSTDETDQAIASFRERLPIESIFEPKQGLAHARNAGVAAADGDYFLWTDDDATVCDTWLSRYETAIQNRPDAAFFGGPIKPRFEGAPPGWLVSCSPLVLTAYAGLDLSAKNIGFGAGSRRLPFGANMAIRAREQRAFSYDPSLGRQPGRLILCGEETDVLRRIIGAGGTGIWLPKAQVEHWIAPDRQSVDYLRRYYTGVGYVAGRRLIAGGRSMDLRKRIATSGKIAWHDGIYVAGRLLGQPEMWVVAMKQSARLRGRLLAQRT